MVVMCRDVYRFATAGAEGMHRDLIERYIQVQAQLLVPITPHTSEHIWSQMLKRPGSVLTSGWPKADEPDFVMQRASQYIEELIPLLRKMIQKMEAPPKEKKGGKGPATPPLVSSAITLSHYIRLLAWTHHSHHLL
jgi:leucyl-tRNA synthetase